MLSFYRTNRNTVRSKKKYSSSGSKIRKSISVYTLNAMSKNTAMCCIFHPNRMQLVDSEDHDSMTV